MDRKTHSKLPRRGHFPVKKQLLVLDHKPGQVRDVKQVKIPEQADPKVHRIALPPKIASIIL